MLHYVAMGVDTSMAKNASPDEINVKMCKGYNIPFALPDRAIGFGPKDPSYP